MPRYLVTLKEVWERKHIVEANSRDEAIEKSKVDPFLPFQEESFTFEYYLDDETQIEIVKN